MNYVIGVDIGTTGIRACVYNEKFELTGSGKGASKLIKGEKGEIYQDPDEIYSEAAKAVRESIAESPAKIEEIACISFDGQMAGILGIDENWSPVIPYDSWLDTRCTAELEEIQKKAGELVVKKTGIIPSFNHGPKILWWKLHEPDRFEKIRSFIQPAAFVAGKLSRLSGDDAFVDWTYAHFSGFADIEGLQWDISLTDGFQIPVAKLPHIISPFTVVGKTDVHEARKFGLCEGIPVAAGCGDTASAFLGAGAVRPGIAVDVAGTASVFAMSEDFPLYDTSGLLYCSRGVKANIWHLMSYINGGGLDLEWFSDNFASNVSFNELDEGCKKIKPGSDGLTFNPHLEGRGYPNQPFMRGQWEGFTRQHGLYHFYRSILESIGYEYALYRDRLKVLSRREGNYEVRVVGGGAKSDVWNQIKADILGLKYCTINRDDIVLLGQALIGAKAVGLVDDIDTVLEHVVRIKKRFHPDTTIHQQYEPYIEQYKFMLQEAENLFYERGSERRG